MTARQPAVYILASKRNGTLYVGVTSDLRRRVWEHRNDLADGFTKKYGVHRLVYFEPHEDMDGAIRREKQIKKWKRAWKLTLIERSKLLIVTSPVMTFLTRSGRNAGEKGGEVWCGGPRSSVRQGRARR